MKFYFYKNNRGFTLVETLVAISILSISILATFTVIQSSLQSSILTKDEIKAFYLIQEGMEFIKNVRDENTLKTLSGTPTNWLFGPASSAVEPCYFGNVCSVDSPAKVVSYCGTNFDTCPFLKEDPVTGLFGYVSGATTNFRREIKLTSIVPDEQILVTVRVSWVIKGQTKSFQIDQLLFNLQS